MSSASPLRRILLVALALTCVVGTGCSSLGHKPLLSTPATLYQEAHRQLENYNFKAAIKIYEALVARYPFSGQARQARLDLIYAYYRDGERDSATDAANSFIRENPTHPRVDYAWYMKGLVNFPPSGNILERLFHTDLSKRPPNREIKAFNDFRTVVREYPNGPYAYDAYRRMVYLRDRLAGYDIHVANYYMRRGAYLAAVRRADDCIKRYEGAPDVQKALEIMVIGYRKLGLKHRAQQALAVYKLNFPHEPIHYSDHQQHWWKIW